MSYKFALFILILNIMMSCSNKAIMYYDKYWKVTNQENATYRSTFIYENGAYVFTRYNILEDRPLSITSYKDKERQIKNGYSVNYFQNGNKASEGKYKNNKEIGIWKDYYDDGILKTEYVKREGKNIHHSYYNKEGEQILNNGNGIMSYEDESNNRIYTRGFEDSLMTSSYYFRMDKKDTVYILSDESAEYDENGMNGFYKLLGENITYPEAARKKGIAGRVFVEFLVLPDKTLEYAKVIKGIDSECDEEAVRVVLLSSGKWNPAVHQGHKVKSIYTVPIFYK